MSANLKAGGCQCGAAKYELKFEKLISWVCHCHGCQKKTASSFGISVPVRRSDLCISGVLKSFQYTSDKGTSYRCLFRSSCGTRMYHESGSNSEYVTLQGGTLDDSSPLNPLAHVWTSRKQIWFVIPHDVEQFETQPLDLKLRRDHLLASA
jgi:hypothetical protein